MEDHLPPVKRQIAEQSYAIEQSLQKLEKKMRYPTFRTLNVKIFLQVHLIKKTK